ncbi:MAG TPA: phosphodiester glycosidase family protein [Roseiflexaceae bacterium]|nr:phosphodiester glycosidase family protein [Roseiflexaceae bacterium]
MTHRRAAIRRILLTLTAAALAGCSRRAAGRPPATRLVPTLIPTGTASPDASAPAAAPTTTLADSGWLAGPQGVELRRVRAPGSGQQPAVPMVVVRLDPAQVRLRVAYDPQNPQTLSAWFEQRRPLLAVNGSFFTQEYTSTALVISDGVARGESYRGFGGMLAVTADERVELWPLRDTPYDPSVPLAQGVQSFPMLVFPGGAPAALEDDGQRARRTAVAIDRAGRLLFVVSPTNGFTLPELSAWLTGADLEVDRALNLDGGSSTGVYLSAGPLSERIDSFGPLPIVITAEAR